MAITTKDKRRALRAILIYLANVPSADYNEISVGVFYGIPDDGTFHWLIAVLLALGYIAEVPGANTVQITPLGRAVLVVLDKYFDV